MNTKIDKKFQDQILKDVRAQAFSTAVRFSNYEMIQGDICEFGCYTGRSLAALTYFHQQYCNKENKHNSKNLPQRTIYGFDSFCGLPASEGHPRWDKGLFSVNHSFHPTIGMRENVTPEKVVNFFEHYGLPKPEIISSYFKDLNVDKIEKVAIVHLDCDLYTSTQEALTLIKPKLVQGSLLLFDDWYHFKGDKNKGERLAFKEFLEDSNIECEEFLRYGTFCKAFLVTSI